MQHIVCKYELYPAMSSYFFHFFFHFAIRTWIKPNPASIGLKTTLLSGQIQTIEIPAIENAVPGHLISVSHTKYIVACFLIGQMGPQGATRPIKWKGLYVQISLFFIMTIRCLTIKLLNHVLGSHLHPWFVTAFANTKAFVYDHIFDRLYLISANSFRRNYSFLNLEIVENSNS